MACPPAAAQNVWTSFVGPPINVVPVSIADSGELPVVVMDTAFPCTVTAIITRWSINM